MNEVRIGIIGIGNMGTAHAKNIYGGKISRLKLTALCDSSKTRLEQLRPEFPDIPLFEDHNELITSGLCDAVIISTPHYFHPTIAIDAFKAGLHVLSEKPVGVYTSIVREEIEAAKASGKVFGIMYNQRTTPIFAFARDFIASGRLGEPKRLVWNITNWYRTQSYYDSGSWRATYAGEGGGVLLNQCVHNIDLWQWIFGMPKSIRAFCAYGKYHNIEVEDDVTVYAEYENGATATFITSTGEAPGTNRLEISGDRAKLVLEGGRVRLWELKVPEREFCFNSEKGFGSPEYTYSELDIDPNGPGHNGILLDFTNAILDGTPLLSPGEEGINALTIINAIQLSDWTDQTVTLPIDAERHYELLKERIDRSSVRKVQDEVHDDGGAGSRWKVQW
ncbi:MAG: Gfo/Idh/MocA family oxidoreductase [Clostridia bacterium]|nr:Gfo/Idh/MocA family oxidoreductase [Clostridia bacterium]